MCIFSLSPAALLSFLSFFFSILFLKMEGGERGRRKESRIEKGGERRRYIRKKYFGPDAGPPAHLPPPPPGGFYVGDARATGRP